MNDQGSRLGVRWAKYLDQTVEARYIIEVESALADEDDLMGEFRQAWFGVRGDFGEVRLGRHLSPTRVSLDPVDMFADQAADQNAVLESEALHDKSIAYINRFDDVGYAVVLSTNDENNRISKDVLINYNVDNLYLAAAYLNGSDQQNTLRLGVSYRFPAGHRVGLAFEKLDDTQSNADHDAYLLSGGYQLGKALLKGQVGRNKPATGEHAETLLGVGIDYEWRKATMLQVQYSINKHRDHTANDKERVMSLGVSYQF